MTHAEAMSAPIVPLDRRTREAKELEVLQNVELQGRIDWDWINESHSRAAAAKRLIDAGKISVARDESLARRWTDVVLAMLGLR